MNMNRMWQWGLGSVVIVLSIVFWMMPVYAYYVCTQKDGSQLFTDNPDADCVKDEGAPVSSAPNGALDEPDESADAAADSMEGFFPKEEVDDEGHNREWWQRRLQALIREREDTLAAISDTEARLSHFKPPHLMYFKLKDDLKALNRFLEFNRDRIKNQLPEAARKAGAPPGWVRE